MDRRPRRLALAVVALLAGTSLFVSGFSLGARSAANPGTPPGEAAIWAPFWDTYRAIRERYALGPVEPRTLVHGAIQGLVESLGDPNSSYLPPDEYRKRLEELSGRFEGVGARIALSDPSCETVGDGCTLEIVDPLPDSPAERAGLRRGDTVVAIDGRSTDGLTPADAIGLVRGPKGTTVVLTIVRDGGEPFDLPIVRAVIVEREVIAGPLADGTVGYLGLVGFSDNAARDLVAALEAHLAAGRRAIVLDLRGNPGGFTTSATTIVSQFLADGAVFWTEDASGERVETPVAPGGVATDPSIRLVVLVDGGSASASEIVAGALQDAGRATLVGEQTFGKGTIQGWQPLDDDAGGFRLTIAKWLTRSTRWIDGEGLTPDVIVAPAPETTTGTGGVVGPGSVSVDPTTGLPEPERDPVLARALAILADGGP